MDVYLPVGDRDYFLLLAVLIFARGMDFLSTWIATPNLVLEANPIARRLGWRAGLILNLVLCLGFATWPLPAVMLITTSLLVAARNFQSAWLMRSLGEYQYRQWICDRVRECPVGTYLFCLLTQTFLIGCVGAALVWSSEYAARPDLGHLVTFAVGAGIIIYALVVTVYTLLSFWRVRRVPA